MEWNYRKAARKRITVNCNSSGNSFRDSLMDHDENCRMFNYIAPYYDKTNRILSLGLDRSWRKKAVEQLMKDRARLILDIGAGTGDIGLSVISKDSNSMVIGIDTSTEMIRQGLVKTRELKLENNISFCCSDALNLCFPDNTFDGAITAFCIRNIEARKAALEEIFRVLKKGSKLVILELTQPQGLFMKPLFNIYSRLITPTITHMMSSVSAYDYLTESMADFPSPSSFIALIQQAGFQNTSCSHLTFGIVTLYESVKP